jgi:hypothetical protein
MRPSLRLTAVWAWRVCLVLAMVPGTALSQPASSARDEQPLVRDGRSAAQIPGKVRVVSLASMTPSQRQLFERSTVRHVKAGFLAVKVPAPWMDVFAKADGFMNSPPLTAEVSDELVLYRVMSSAGAPVRLTRWLTEAADRDGKLLGVSRLYDLASGARAILTERTFERNAPAFVVVAEYLNQTVLGQPAVLTRLESSGVKKSLWKLTWFTDTKRCEMYWLLPGPPSAKPAQDVASVLRLTQSILQP